jgi:hypothetical protein
MDHEAMRQAMNRALQEIHNNFCNNCKNPYQENQGGYTDLVTFEKIYKIWYCKDCFKSFQNEDDSFKD